MIHNPGLITKQIEIGSTRMGQGMSKLFFQQGLAETPNCLHIYMHVKDMKYYGITHGVWTSTLAVGQHPVLFLEHNFVIPCLIDLKLGICVCCNTVCVVFSAWVENNFVISSWNYMHFEFGMHNCCNSI